MLLCAITDGTRLANLIDRAVSWSEKGVDFIQLREKDLDPAALVSLAKDMLAKIDRSQSKLLVNVSSAEAAGLALEAGVDGVHLAGQLVPGAAGNIRRAFPDAIISMPCHDLDEVEAAWKERVDFVLFSPVFEKVGGKVGEKPAAPPQGVAALARACRAAQGIPVLALGGVTAANAPNCLAAGAAGVAGIRLFGGAAWPSLSMAKPRYIVE